MTTQEPASLSLQQAHQLLKQFDCLKRDLILAPDQWESIRQALLLVAQHSDYQMLGVCADSVEQGAIALKQYANALGYEPDLAMAPVEGPAYLKFNPKSGRCYADTYPGEHRGVLVSCQSADEEDINDMYGHLPLDLFKQII